MRAFKLISISFCLLFGLITSTKAQDMSNLYAILADGYTIDELHDYVDRLTLNNHRSILEGAGMKFVKNDTDAGFYVYTKNEYVSFYVNYENGKLTSVQVKSSPQKFYKAIEVIKGNSKFVKSS